MSKATRTRPKLTLDRLMCADEAARARAVRAITAPIVSAGRDSGRARWTARSALPRERHCQVAKGRMERMMRRVREKLNQTSDRRVVAADDHDPRGGVD